MTRQRPQKPNFNNSEKLGRSSWRTKPATRLKKLKLPMIANLLKRRKNKSCSEGGESMDIQKRVEDILRAYRPPLSNENIEDITGKILAVINPPKKKKTIKSKILTAINLDKKEGD